MVRRRVVSRSVGGPGRRDGAHRALPGSQRRRRRRRRLKREVAVAALRVVDHLFERNGAKFEKSFWTTHTLAETYGFNS